MVIKIVTRAATLSVLDQNWSLLRVSNKIKERWEDQLNYSNYIDKGHDLCGLLCYDK